jgi:glycosyltransferase involved in cell wall biosynthesis
MIVSTTLTASNADLIGDALASVVAHVDRCLVIDTGARDDTLEVARRVAGEKLLVREFPWRDDFAAARNFALDAAAEAGGEWAVTVDTDERLLVDPGFDLRAALAATPARVLHVAVEDGGYAKERILRLPAPERWTGPTHEALGGQRAGESAVLAGMRFRELPKDSAALRRKLERDIGILRRRVRSGDRRLQGLRRARRLAGGSRVGLLPRCRVLREARALERGDRALREGTRDPPGHRRARVARRLCGLQVEALRGRHRVVEHGDGERPARRCGRGLSPGRLPPPAGIVRRALRRAALDVPGARQ